MDKKNQADLQMHIDAAAKAFQSLYDLLRALEEDGHSEELILDQANTAEQELEQLTDEIENEWLK